MAAAPRRSLLIALPVGIVVALVLAVFGYAMVHGINAGRPNGMVGKPAQEFTYKTFDGKTVDLAALHGQPVMVNFWGSWCVPCSDEAPVLSQAWQQYKNSGVQFVGIAIWDKADAAQQFAQQNGAVWLNGLDPDGKIAINYGVYGVPESFFISRDGVLVDRYVGPFVGQAGSAQLDQFLQKLVAR